MLGPDVNAPSTPGDHRMDWSAYLELKLGQLFPEPEQRATAEAELGRYGMGDYEKEVERVQLAILKLSGSDLERLRANVRAAKGDYRVEREALGGGSCRTDQNDDDAAEQGCAQGNGHAGLLRAREIAYR